MRHKQITYKITFSHKDMNKLKIIINVLFAVILGDVLASVTQLDAVYTIGGVLVAQVVSSIVQPTGVLLGVTVEIWKNDIIENLFKDNSFLNYAFNADSYVIGGKVVHIPEAGAKPSAEKNRSSLPAAVKVRTDGDVVYLIDEFTTDPILIKNADEVELSYDKRQSVLSEHQLALNEIVGDWMLYNWFTYTYNSVTTTGQILRTSGTASASYNPHSTATGTRKKFVKEDLQAAQTLMNKNNIPKQGRYAIVPSDMMAQLLDDTDLKQRDGANGGEANLQEGVIMRLYGFNIIDRSSVLLFTNAGTPVAKEPTAADAATDNNAVLCYQMNSVERAKGAVEFFENENDPTYYGSIYSALVRMGGRIRRSKGVVAIVQTLV